MRNNTGGLRLYEHLKSFAESRSQNESKLQQALYSDMLNNLTEDPPNTDAEAMSKVYLIVSFLLKFVADVYKYDPVYEEINAETREILAILAHYKVKDSE